MPYVLGAAIGMVAGLVAWAHGKSLLDAIKSICAKNGQEN